MVFLWVNFQERGYTSIKMVIDVSTAAYYVNQRDVVHLKPTNKGHFEINAVYNGIIL